MSKSDADSAIFMEDTAEDVERKIMGAHCPREPEDASPAEEDELHLVVDTLKNPCLDYVEHIVLSAPGASFTAGGVEFTGFAAVREAFVSGALSEADLKKVGTNYQRLFSSMAF